MASGLKSLAGQPNYQLLVLLALACRRQCVAEVSINLIAVLAGGDISAADGIKMDKLSNSSLNKSIF